MNSLHYNKTSELHPSGISHLKEDSLNLNCLNSDECIANGAILFRGILGQVSFIIPQITFIGGSSALFNAQ